MTITSNISMVTIQSSSIPAPTCIPSQRRETTSCMKLFTNTSDYDLCVWDPDHKLTARNFYYETDRRFGWSWVRPSGGTNLTWINLRTGPLPWGTPTGQADWILPKKIRDIQTSKIHIGYKYLQNPTHMDLLMDIWIAHTFPFPSTNTGNFEIMIPLTDQTGRNCNWGGPCSLGTLNDGYNQYKVQQWCGSDGTPCPCPHRWIVYMLCNNKSPCEACDNYFGQRNYTINLKAILNDLINRGMITSDEYLACIDFGVEAFPDGYSAGKVEMNQYRIELNDSWTC